MANAGRVELDLVAVGKDQVSAMLRTLEGNVRKTAGEMEKAGVSARTLGDRIGATVSPIQNVATLAQTTASKLSGMSAAIIGGFVGAASAGVVGALRDLVTGLVDVATEFFRTEPRIDDLAAASIAAANDAAKLSAQITNIGIAAAEAGGKMSGFGARILTLSAQLATMRGQTALAATFIAKAEVAATGDVILGIEKSMKATETAANDAVVALRKLTPALDEQARVVKSLNLLVEYRKSLGLDVGLQQQQLGVAAAAHSLLTAEVTRTEFAYRQASDAVAKMSEELALQDSIQSERQSPNKVSAEVVAKTIRGGGGNRRAASDVILQEQLRLTSLARHTAELDAGLTTGVDALQTWGDTIVDQSAHIDWMDEQIRHASGNARDMADAFNSVSAAVSLAGQSFAGLGDSLSEVSGFAQAYAATQTQLAVIARDLAAEEITVDKAARLRQEAQSAANDALVGGAQAGAAAVAKLIGGVRAEAAVRAAFSVGMGFATLANPVVSAGHFTAAALLGAVALGAGGGGARGGGSARGGSSGGSSGGGGNSGPTTVVNNFSTLVTDPHHVSRALQQTSRAVFGTGTSERRAA